MDTLTIVLYSLSQWSEYAGQPDESFARKSVYSRPDTGCKSGVRARIYITSYPGRIGFTQYPNTIVVRSVVSCLYVWSILLTYF